MEIGIGDGAEHQHRHRHSEHEVAQPVSDVRLEDFQPYQRPAEQDENEDRQDVLGNG
ncbi:hypothetical protein D3C87_2179760 [compost metagenome]